MEKILELAEQGCFWEATEQLINFLQEKRTSLTDDEWDVYVSDYLMKHPIKQFVYLCPYTKRSFDKPRGYAGDAVLIDYLYGLNHPISYPEGMSYESEEILRCTTNHIGARTVRYRKKYFSEVIDEICIKKSKAARILSIAAGHFRETELSQEIKKGNFDCVVALDQDKESLKLVEREYGKYGVETEYANVATLISNPTQFKNFDLVYAAGLFDYLERKVAIRLLKAMYEMLGAKGKLIISNFAPNNPARGYMESYMDWKLIYREESEVFELLEQVTPNTDSVDTFYDPNKIVVFGMITKC